MKNAKSRTVQPEVLTESNVSHGDLFILHSKRTGLALGHTPTAVEGAKRIEWVRNYATEHHLTPSKVVRLLLNEAIDRRVRSSKNKE